MSDKIELRARLALAEKCERHSNNSETRYWCDQYKQIARAALTPQPAPVNKSVIRDVFLRNGFTIKEGQTDLKPYVYAAAEELLSLDGKAVAIAQAMPEDVILRSRIADLLHLLQFTKIETPSHGDAAQVEIAMNDLERLLSTSGNLLGAEEKGPPGNQQ